MLLSNLSLSRILINFISPDENILNIISECPVEEYERSWEQNEELGLNDMDTSSADAAYNTTDAPPMEQID